MIRVLVHDKVARDVTLITAANAKFDSNGDTTHIVKIDAFPGGCLPLHLQKNGGGEPFNIDALLTKGFKLVGQSSTSSMDKDGVHIFTTYTFAKYVDAKPK